MHIVLVGRICYSRARRSPMRGFLFPLKESKKHRNSLTERQKTGPVTATNKQAEQTNIRALRLIGEVLSFVHMPPCHVMVSKRGPSALDFIGWGDHDEAMFVDRVELAGSEKPDETHQDEPGDVEGLEADQTVGVEVKSEFWPEKQVIQGLDRSQKVPNSESFL
eukprot:5644908-Amphidinium_carterae.2